tara:strand:+ start:38014 stop:38913 length:900 start_codon:yes stop_codon:yes gene_type:complete
MEECPFCQSKMIYSGYGKEDTRSVNCPRCGHYAITQRAIVNVRNTHLSDRQKANISSFLSENQGYKITSHSLEFFENLTEPNFIEKSNHLLYYLEKLTVYAGFQIKEDESMISRAWCLNEAEFSEVVQYLASMERILWEQVITDVTYKILPKGWMKLEELETSQVDSKQAFVAMWFSDEMKNVYEQAIAPGILEAGYMPHRVDLREHNEKIDDEIISQIRKSKFLIADFTGHRGGVYFEAGFAKGLGLEVFWLCNQDDLDNLHFDIRQYNCIVWNFSDMVDLRRRLCSRIESVLGNGKN